jgi:YHS domain-containing protein
MSSRRPALRLLALAVAAAIPLAAAAANVKVKPVDPKSVCMLMDHTADHPEHPVVIGGKTYYYGTDDCRGKLSADPANRVAVDPVTHKKVDKATAVLGATPAGDVLYFESAKTLAHYNAKG